MKGYSLASMALVLVIAVALVGVYDFLEITGMETAGTLNVPGELNTSDVGIVSEQNVPAESLNIASAVNEAVSETAIIPVTTAESSVNKEIAAIGVKDSEGRTVPSRVIAGEIGAEAQSGKRAMTLELNEASSPVKKIEFKDIQTVSDMFIGIDDVPEEKSDLQGTVEIYAIDPTRITFTEAIVTAVAKGNELWKCKNWDFDGQTCTDGNWEKLMDITPGQEYSFTLTPKDPGYAETGTLSAWLAYYTTTNPTLPKYRIWNGTMRTEANATDVGVGADTEWVVLKSSQINDQKILATLDDLGAVKAQLWGGINQTWGNIKNISTAIGTTNDAYRGVDVAYERPSGRALVVASNGTATPVYNIWNGTGWQYASSQLMPTDGCTGTVVWIVLKARNSSNEILEVDQDTNGDYCANIWNGTAWINNKTLDTAPTTYTTQRFDAAYESSSGDALVVWEKETIAGLLWYNTYSGGVWGTSLTTGKDPGGANVWVRLAAMPDANRIMIGTLETAGSYDANAVEWSGNGWGTLAAIDTAVETTAGLRYMDVAYIGSTGNAMIAYVDADADVPSYATCSGANCAAGTWAAATNTTPTTNFCGSAAADMGWIGLDADPFSNKTYLWGKAQTNFGKCFQEWNGTAWGTWNNNLGSGAILGTTEDVMASADKFKDTTPPAVTLVAPTPINDTVQYANYTLINVTVTENETFIRNCTLDFITNSSMTMVGTGASVTCNLNKTDIPEGTYTYRVYASNVAGITGVSEARTIMVDRIPPSWSNNKTFPASTTTYSPTANYQFNTTWTDNRAVSTVIFEHNFTGVAANYSPAGNFSSEYYYNYGTLAAGTYYWKSYANDTVGNLNSTPQFDYVVNKASSLVNLTLNDVDNDTLSVQYQVVNITGYVVTPSSGHIEIYENGTLLSSGNSSITVLKNYTVTGTYNITVIYNATQNYTAGFETHMLTIVPVNIIPPTWSGNATYPASPATYSPAQTYQFNITWTDDIYLGTALFEHNFTGVSVNYSPTGFAGNTTNREYYYNYGPLAIGTYYWKSYANDTNGNLNITPQFSYTVNQATPVLTINATPSFTVTYGTQTNVSCTANTAQVTPQLYRNGTFVSNPDVQTLAAGTYNYTCNNTATQNYTSTSTSQLLTVNKVSSLVNLTINGIDNNVTVDKYSTVNITAYVVIPPSGYVEIYDNNTLINNGSSPLTNLVNYSSSGLHNITVVYNATQNYTASFETHFITVFADTTPPNVTNVVPVAASNYNQSQTVLISANITDYSPISSTTAGVSWSNNSESCAMNRRLFYDDFSDSNLTQWTIILGNWTITAGQVFTAVSEFNRSMIVAGDSNWTNYTYYTEVKQNGNVVDDLDGVLVFRYVNLSNYYKIEMDVDTAGFHIDRMVDGTETILNATNFTYEANVWYSQKILVNGSAIKAKVWKYGAQEPDWMITATDTAMPSGKVGYTIYSSNATFDNSRVDLLKNDGLSGTYDCEFTNTSYIGRYNVTILANDSNSNVNNTQTTYFFINDVTPPIVRLMSPGNNSYALANANFTFNASDNSGFALNCSLYIDSVLTATNQSVQLDTPTTFAVFGMTQGLGKIWNVTCIDVGNNAASSARTFNVDISAPSTSITSPTNGTNTSDPTPAITFVSTDNLAASVNYVIFVDGVANGQIGTATNNTQTSVNLFQLSQTGHTIVVGATDTAGNSQNSTPLAIAIVPPTVYLSYPPYNAYLGNQGINFTFNVSDPTFPTLNCSLYINGLLNQTNGTTTRYVTTTFAVTGIQQGANQTWNVSCTNPVNATASDAFTFNIDLNAPNWSNKTETPASFANYSNSTNYQFTLNWTDNIGVANVQIEHNFYGALANYSVNNSGAIYYYSPATLAAGNYSWRMYANDSVGNLNQTGQFSYTVNKAAPVLTLTADPAFVAYNGTLTSVGCTANTWQVSVQLYRNGSLVSNPNTATLPVGIYGYVCNSTATQNYTAAQTSDILQITAKNLTFCPLYFSPTSGQSYPVSVNASCSCTNPETTATLWRGGVNVTATENNKLVALAAGSYNYICNSTETGNYSYGETASTYVINKTATTCSLTSNPTSPQTYGTTINASCSCTNPEASAKLYRNGTDVTATENRIFTTLPAGTWFYNCTVVQTQNYTYAENTSTYVMNKATPALTINATPSFIVTYGNQTNTSCTASTTQITPQLYRNGTLVSNPDVQTLAASTYNYTCNAAATQNYTTPTQQSSLLTVNQAGTSTQLYLNGSRSNITLPYNAPLNITASTNVFNLSLYIDSIFQTVGNFISQIFYLAAGLHNITAINYGNENYTSSYETWFADILKTASSCSLTFTPSSPQTYGTTINASCSCTNPEVAAKLYKNGTNVTAIENGVYTLLAAGIWDYVCNVSATQNYTAAGNSSNYTINKAASALTLSASPSWNETYGTITNISCIASTPQITPQPYRNGTPVSNPDVQTLAASSYSYICTATETQNYTAPAPQSNTLVISKASSIVNLTLNGIDNDVTILPNQNINITGYVIAPNSGYIELYNNGTLINSGQSPLTSIRNYSTEGIRNITVIYNATQNYTASYEMHFINVSLNDTSPPIITFVSPTPGNNTTRNQNWAYINATAVDTQSAIDTCTLQFNGTNYTMAKVGTGLSVSCYRNHTASEGTYSYKVYANDSHINTDVGETRTITIDITPSASVSSLNEAATGENWIYWNWTNPADADFNHTEVWINDTFRANVSAPANSYNVTGLAPNTTYEIQTRTTDNAGNINTTFVNDTATTNVSVDTTPPVISAVRNGTVTNTTAIILWDTDDFANATVIYGTNPTNLSSIGASISYVQNHSVLLASLAPNTIYYYNITSCSAGGCNSSGTYNFTTVAVGLPDGSVCTLPIECLGGFCVHGICRSTAEFCGDGFCDGIEGCSSCSTDCGSCGGGGGTGGVPGVPAIPITPSRLPLLVPGESEQISTIEHSEPGHILGSIEFAPSGKVARIDSSITASGVYEIGIIPNVDITDAVIEITKLDTITVGNRAEFVPTHITTGTVEIGISIADYDLGIAEFVYSAFSIEHLGLEGKISEVILKFKVDKAWMDANTIDPTTTILRRQHDNEWQLLKTYLIDEDADYYYYVGISPGLSTFSIIATSPPLLCSICKSGDWSSCIDGEQTRLGQDCGSHTGYTCRPIVESRLCEVPTVPTPPSLPLDIIIIPIVGVAVGSYVLFSRKKSW